jgi:flagellin-like hook-associated protein FlgL
LKEKVINAANDTNTDSDRATIQKELDQSIDQIDDNANVNYNGKYLLDGSKNNKIEATYTHLTNQNLSTDTTGATKLTDLRSRAGDELQLQKTDEITVSYVQQGKTFSTSFKVEDRTLQDIFNEAENIDTNTKTFASNDNKSVSEVTGNRAANGDFAAIKNAVAELKKTLGRGDLTTSNMNVKFTSAPTDAAIRDGSVDFTLKESAVITSNSSVQIATTNGDLYNQLKSAAADAQNSYNEMTSVGSALKTALNGAGISWDSGEKYTDSAELKTKTFQDKIAAADDSVKTAYENYAKAVDTFYANKKTAEDALTNYNDKLEQLGALSLEQDYYQARSDYETGVSNFLNKLETAALDNSADAFTYTNSAGETLTSPALDANRSDFVKTMIKDLRSQLLEINPGSGHNMSEATSIVEAVKIGDSKVNELEDTAPYKSLGKEADALLETASTVDDTLAALDESADVHVALEKAHQDALKSYTSPTLMTGSNIGIDGAGKMHSTASGENALTIVAANSGVNGQIAGFTIGVKDAQGNARKSAEASLDAFDESIRGQNASADNAVNLQIGTKANQTITVGLTDMRSQALGLKGSDGSTLNIGNRENANAAINVIDNALAKVLDQATSIGAVQNRLEYTSSNLTTSSENVTASESTIRDADMAKEMTEYTKNNVLLSASQSMLSQANQNSMDVMTLLQ